MTLYRGIVPVLQSLCASNFVYFYTFHGLKAMHTKYTQTAGRDLLFASIAGNNWLIQFLFSTYICFQPMLKQWVQWQLTVDWDIFSLYLQLIINCGSYLFKDQFINGSLKGFWTVYIYFNVVQFLWVTGQNLLVFTQSSY